MSTKLIISEGCRVTLHFSVALPAGEIIDSNFDKQPANFVVGDGNMLPGFESSLLGLKKGETIEKLLAPEQAFGSVNPENIQKFTREQFKLFLDDEFAELTVGSVVSFKDPAGFDIPGVVKEKSESLIEVDFNHPLAGRDIMFKAEIVDITSGDVENIDIKL